MANMKTSREHIYKQIWEEIIRGNILPGEKVIDSELAKTFNVSRTPVREAILQLEKEGLIAHKQNCGFVVKKISREEIAEIFDLISELEAYAVRKVAAQRISKGEIFKLKLYMENMSRYSHNKDHVQYLRNDSKFHHFFTIKCGNSALQNFVSSMRDRIYRVTIYMMGLTLWKHIDIYMEDHAKIVEATNEGRDSEAEAIMKKHIQDSKRFFLEAIDQMGIKKGI